MPDISIFSWILLFYYNKSNICTDICMVVSCFVTSQPAVFLWYEPSMFLFVCVYLFVAYVGEPKSDLCSKASLQLCLIQFFTLFYQLFFELLLCKCVLPFCPFMHWFLHCIQLCALFFFLFLFVCVSSCACLLTKSYVTIIVSCVGSLSG